MGITATQNLHYTDGTDAVEDHSTNLEVLARQLDSRMHLHDLDADRFGADLPMCVLESSAPQTINWNVNNVLLNSMKFDTVLIDSDNMANLDALPYAMTFNTLGFWQVGFYAWSPTLGCLAGSGSSGLFSANNSVPNDLGNVTTFGGTSQSVFDGDTGNVAGQGASLARVDGFPATWGWVSVSPNGGTNCASIVTINYVRLWAFKVRDYP